MYACFQTIDCGLEKTSSVTSIPTFAGRQCMNNFLEPGEITTSIIWKSAFNGGAGGGTGHQNISTRIDYGLQQNALLSLYLSETDDPLFNLIDDKFISFKL